MIVGLQTRLMSQEVIPTQFVFFSLAAIVGSAVLYQEFRDVPFNQFVNFAFGVSLPSLPPRQLPQAPTAA